MSVVAVVVVAITAIIAAEVLNKRNTIASLRLQATRIGAFHLAELERETTRALMAARATALAFEAEPEMPLERYEVYGRRLVNDNPSVINVAAAPGLVVDYVYPVEENRSIIGLNYREMPEQLIKVKTTLASSEPLLAGPMDLIQGGRGLILRQRIEPAPGQTPEAAGIVSVVLNADRFFQSAGLTGSDDGFALAIRAVDSPDAAARPVLGDPSVFDMQPVIFPLQLPATVWQLALVPTGGWPVMSAQFWQYTLGLAMIATAALLMMFRLERSRRRRETVEFQLNAAFNAIDDGFALFGADHRLLASNQKFSRIMSGAPDPIPVGTPYETILENALHAGMFAAVGSGRHDWISARAEMKDMRNSQWQEQMKDGRWFNISQQQLEGGSMTVVATNVTPLMEALHRSEAANAAKSRFLDSVSHELRTPLSVLMGYNAFLTRPERLREGRDALDACAEESNPVPRLEAFDAFTRRVTDLSERVAISAKQLQSMIDKLLDVSGKEAKNSDGPRRVRAGQLLGPVAARFRKEAERKGLDYRVIIEDSKIIANPIPVEHAFACLIENAVKFTANGIVEVRLSPSGPSKVKFEVTDSGPGIPPHMRANVADAFEKGCESDYGGAAGLGLGLKIAQQVARDHGGELVFGPGIGTGTSVAILFEHAPEGPGLMELGLEDAM